MSNKKDYLISCSELVTTALEHKIKCSLRVDSSIAEIEFYKRNSELIKGRFHTLEDEVKEASQNYEFADKAFQNALELWEKAFKSVQGDKPVAYANTLQTMTQTFDKLPG
jgi:hypothetical protein